MMDYTNLILGILVLLLGILLIVERVRRTDFKGDWFTTGFYNNMFAAVLIVILGLIFIFDVF